MPDVRNCKRCNKIFKYLSGPPICLDCKQQDEDKFKIVKEYLYENPKASVYEVSKELEISVQLIKSFLKEGRLEIIGEDGNMFLECERCGKSISTGRYCESCAREITDDIRSVAGKIKGNPNEPASGGKSGAMRYLHKKW
jgi:flagellar operon protein (TIGR03826 family)